MKQKRNKKETPKPLEMGRSLRSFIREENTKIARVINQALRMGYHYDGKVIDRIITTSELNFLTFRTDGTISYLPKGKELKYNDSGDWSREGRQNGKASKVLRKLLTPLALKYFTDADLECFANSYKAQGEKEKKTFKILPNTDIKKVYDSNREGCNGSLNGSCMNNDISYLDIYENCPSLEIIALYNQVDLLSGRALLWTLPDGTKLMDRIYVAEDCYYELFLDFAVENRFTRKLHYKSYDYKDIFVDFKGIEFRGNYRIEMPTDWENYPYIDTFQYGGDGYLTNENGSTYGYAYTDGTRSGDDKEFCQINQRYYPSNQVTYIDRGRYEGEYIQEDLAITIGRYTYWQNDDDIVEVNGDWYAKDSEDICYVDMHDEYYMDDECVFSEDREEYILQSESIEIDGDYYHEDDVQSVACIEVNGELIEESEITHVVGYMVNGKIFQDNELNRG